MNKANIFLAIVLAFIAWAVPTAVSHEWYHPVSERNWFSVATWSASEKQYSREEIEQYLFGISFPLYEKGPKGEPIDGCTGFNAALGDSGMAVMIAAGHCHLGNAKYVIGDMAWNPTFLSLAFMNGTDFVVSDKPFCEGKELVAKISTEKNTFHKGETYYYLAQNGVREKGDRVIERKLGTLTYDRYDKDFGHVFLLGEPQEGKSFDFFTPPEKTGYRVVGGVSGSALVNGRKEVVGIIVGINNFSYHEVFVVPENSFRANVEAMKDNIKTWSPDPSLCEDETEKTGE